MACECYHQKQEQYSGSPRYGSSFRDKKHVTKTSSSRTITTNSTRNYYFSISVWKTLLTFCILLAANPLTKVKGLKVGEKIRLLCFPEAKPDDLSGRRFEWLLNGTLLKANDRIQFRKGNTVLRMKDATDRDVGRYTCQEVLGDKRKLEITVYKVEFGKNLLKVKIFFKSCLICLIW